MGGFWRCVGLCWIAMDCDGWSLRLRSGLCALYWSCILPDAGFDALLLQAWGCDGQIVSQVIQF
jgi:hypothetical protein